MLQKNFLHAILISIFILQASDGWYWKWLSKWKKRSKSHDQDRLIGAETDDCLSIATEVRRQLLT